MLVGFRESCNIEYSSNELNKVLSEIWAGMTDEERLPYEQSAFDDKDRIRREVERVKRKYSFMRSFIVVLKNL